MIPEKNRLIKHNEYLFMQDRARAHTTKLTLEMLKDKKQLQLLEPDQWPLNSPDLNLVDLGDLENPGEKCIARLKDN